MEGVSHRRAPWPGTWAWAGSAVLWDDNDITIDGAVGAACSADQLARFAAYGWHVQAVPDGTDVAAIDAALTAAKWPTSPELHRRPHGHRPRRARHRGHVQGARLPARRGGAGPHQGAGRLATPPFTVPAPVQAACAELGAAGRRPPTPTGGPGTTRGPPPSPSWPPSGSERAPDACPTACSTGSVPRPASPASTRRRAG
ncbi:MAG: hypothetical protein R2734_17525 [Nocardioides sp.]